ncbi:MAG: hypothetical protein ACRYGK_10450 [Janthinobacterium lividum]
MERVEYGFGANGEWEDPLGMPGVIGPIENMEAAMRRSPPTHAKGYFSVRYFFETDQSTSKVEIELNRNGTVRTIKILQQEK